jgi:hypothetical protein
LDMNALSASAATYAVAAVTATPSRPAVAGTPSNYSSTMTLLQAVHEGGYHGQRSRMLMPITDIVYPAPMFISRAGCTYGGNFHAADLGTCASRLPSARQRRGGPAKCIISPHSSSRSDLPRALWPRRCQSHCLRPPRPHPPPSARPTTRDFVAVRLPLLRHRGAQQLIHPPLARPFCPQEACDGQVQRGAGTSRPPTVLSSHFFSFFTSPFSSHVLHPCV